MASAANILTIQPDIPAIRPANVAGLVIGNGLTANISTITRGMVLHENNI